MRADNGRFLPGTHWRSAREHWDAEWLRNEYVNLGRSTGDIAEGLGITDAAVIYWLKKHGIGRRNTSQARLIKRWGCSGEANPMFGKTGAANPRFIDGGSPERQRLYAQEIGRQFVRDVLVRDCYRCQRCGGIKRGSKSLHVHHIKPWAGNPALRFDCTNAVTLCRGCHNYVHSKANISREFLA